MSKVLIAVAAADYEAAQAERYLAAQASKKVGLVISGTEWGVALTCMSSRSGWNHGC